MACLLLPGSARGADRWTIGLTSGLAPIDATVVPGSSELSPTVLVVSGLAGSDASSDAVEREAAAFDQIPQERRAFRLIAITRANPEARPLQFPPSGVAYPEQAESHVLWRRIATHAPDLVLIVGPDPGLAQALGQGAVLGVGAVPVRRVDPADGFLRSLAAPDVQSRARTEIDRRLRRSPRDLAGELARVYGGEFAQPNYIAAMAMVGRLRLGQRDEVAALLTPYLDGTRDSFARPSQSSLASHIVFFEYARRTGDERARAALLRAAAGGFTESGELRDFMPLHGGWSDSLFMDVPVLAMAGSLTGEKRYFDMAARHVAFMQKLVRRPDGLYRHQASAEAAWGRGNAFPALGLALTLSEFPQDHPEFATLLALFRSHMEALARHQDENGMWRNVIDHPGAYPEYSATAMIATAMLKGIRRGWLDRATYEPLVEKAWTAIATRTSPAGEVIDACESTGTRGLTDDDYLRRAAIAGRDDRSGGMALYFATELAGL